MKRYADAIIVYISLAVIVCNSPALGSAHRSLDSLAIQFGTDKSSKWHNYTAIYERYFEGIRSKALHFLEIGFGHGASARMWQQYFPKASLHVIELDLQAMQIFGQNLSPRVHLHHIDQSNKDALVNFIKRVGVAFDIIIDDGSHVVSHQIISFQALFPSVKSGGIYIIEDLHTSYWQADAYHTYGGGGTIEKPQANAESAIRFCQALIDDLNYVGARNGCADFKKCPPALREALSYYQQHILSIHFYDSVCIILKR